MRVAVFGSYDWDSYNDFIRSMTVFIQDVHELGHDNVIFVHSGKTGAENMVTEYINKTEKFLRQKDFKVKEEFFRGRAKFANVEIIESGIDYALVFSTQDKRAVGCKKLLEAYNIPFAVYESA